MLVHSGSVLRFDQQPALEGLDDDVLRQELDHIQQNLEAGFAFSGWHLSGGCVLRKSLGRASGFPQILDGWPWKRIQSMIQSAVFQASSFKLLLITHWGLYEVPQDDFCHSRGKSSVEQLPFRECQAPGGACGPLFQSQPLRLQFCPHSRLMGPESDQHTLTLVFSHTR